MSGEMVENVTPEMEIKLRWEEPEMVTPLTEHPTFVYELSNLDLRFPRDYFNNGVLYFDVANKEFHDDRRPEEVLRKALGELLDHCPWLAGRLRENPSTGRREVIYEAQGVHFVVARCDHLALSDLGDVSEPNAALYVLHAFNADLPPSVKPDPAQQFPLLGIQVTTFKCGSFTLAMCSNHNLLDGVGAGMFLQNLCSIAKGDGLAIPIENVHRRLLFQPKKEHIVNDLPSYLHTIKNAKAPITKFETFIPIRYKFRQEDMQRLRKDILDLQTNTMFNVATCSRYEALIALIWKAKATSLIDVPLDYQLGIRMAKNIRGKVVPSIPMGYLGNGLSHSWATSTVEELRNNSLAFVVNKIIDALTSVTQESVQKEIDAIENVGPNQVQFNFDSVLTIPSIVGLGFYKANCGWGLPIYVGRQTKQYKVSIFVVEGSSIQPPSWDVLIVLPFESERLLFEEVIKPYVYSI